MYEPRTYRCWVEKEDLASFTVVVNETDLLIRATTDLSSQALDLVRECRAGLESYIRSHLAFLYSLKPIPVDEDAPPVVKDMARAGEQAGVGPMAAVAGAIAQEIGLGLLDFSEEVIVENGGDIFMKCLRPRRIGVYAGVSPLTGKIAFEVRPEQTPLGVCTSSGTVGPSLSLGRADAVITFSPWVALADAAATAIGNQVQSADDIQPALEFAKLIPGLTGAAIIKGDVMGVWGDVTLASNATS
jgi:ApbE superfamily uncharacterized protein (UPF0280 family)